MATVGLIHGGGGSAWDWHLVEPALRRRGHDPVAAELPIDDESAGWADYVDTVAASVGTPPDLVMVGHSLGGFTAALVAARLPVRQLVLVAAMIPAPGETVTDWWDNADYHGSGSDDIFYHDVPPGLAAEARRRERDERSRTMHEPSPLRAWPDVPTSYLLLRDDRMFTADWARGHARERLGIEADEMDGGHYAPLSRPEELAEQIDAYAARIR